jgi:hypothetical protein
MVAAAIPQDVGLLGGTGRNGLLLADRTVDRLPSEVGVPGMAGRLLDEVQEHPAKREVPTIAKRSHR